MCDDIVELSTKNDAFKMKLDFTMNNGSENLEQSYWNR